MEETDMAERHGALENITVLDLGRVIAAPFCASILADMGARVIKVERPGKGDDSRQYGPYVNGESAYYANMNRNKEGITLNMKDPRGKEILKELVKKADVLIENFRPGVMDKLGLGYDVLKEINPQLVYLEISGFGGYGRYSQRPGSQGRKTHQGRYSCRRSGSGDLRRSRCPGCPQCQNGHRARTKSRCGSS